MKLLLALAVVVRLGGMAHGQTAAPKEAPSQSADELPPPDVPRVYRVGGDVKPPVPISMPEPDFSEQTRKKKVSGTVRIGLVVDTEGNPQQVHVVRSLVDQVKKKDAKAALSLDAKALEAVRQYRFKPAMKDGRPVPVEMNIEVNFQIF